MRVWLVGGGTAGHVSPLLSVATELEAAERGSPLSIRLITDWSPASDALGRLMMNYPRHRLPNGKLRRYRGLPWRQTWLDIRTWLLNIRDAGLLAAGMVYALVLVLRHKPDVIFINGGSIGVPVAVAAWLAKRPYVIHESDSVMGLANRLIAGRAALIATAFDINLNPQLAAKRITVGIPLDSQFLRPRDEQNLAKLAAGLGLSSQLPTVLALGGSLGAQRLNHWLISQADDLLERCQLILVTGQSNYQACQAMVDNYQLALASRLHLLDYSDRVADLMQLADVVITRAGATTLMEVAAVGKPALIIPNDSLPGGHQTANAQWFASAGRAESLAESVIAAEPAQLIRAVVSLLDDEPRRRRLAEAISKLHMPNSASEVAKLLGRVGKPA